MDDAQRYNAWHEMLRLIAQYDWATEGASAPEGTTVSRVEAVAIRNALVGACKEILT